MPFTDTISVVSGRNSRASNVSGITGASRSIRSQPVPKPQNDTLASAGVLSMLKTTTDTGDIGALSYNRTHFPAMTRAVHQRRGHHSKHSGSHSHGMTSHHHYAPSQTSRVSSSREWDAASTHQRRGSFTSLQSMPPALPPVHLGRPPQQMPPPPTDLLGEARSYSLSAAQPTQPLPRHRSAASLKSQGHEPRGADPRAGYPPPAGTELRPQYIYPTRLKRPGYRSPSPALSDTLAPGPPPTALVGSRRMPMPRPPPQTYNSEYGTEYSTNPRQLQARPPPRAMSNSPVMGYGESQAPYPYRNPAAMRSAPGLMAPKNQAWSHHPHPPAAQPHPMMQRPPYPGPPYPPRPGYPHYAYAHYPIHGGPTPPINMAAQHMFHSAARLARSLPSRTDTPLTGPPSSSDPPSSGTAPSCSSPPTPQDQSTLQVAVDPAFIDPALMDVPDTSSEPGLHHQYLRYADGLEKDVDEPEVEAHHSVPPSGFVQRVKAMLESKAAAEAAAMKESEREKANHHAMAVEHPVELNSDDLIPEGGEAHELAANEEPRFTIIEEYEGPAELPASPVKIAEPKRRLTRDLVKAGLATSSVDNTLETDTTGQASIDMLIQHQPVQGADTAVEINIVQKAAQDAQDDRASAVTSIVPHHVRSKTESDASVAIAISGADYALRFETTAVSEETRTEDPFVLDADTITLQHQRSRENTVEATEQLVDTRQPHHQTLDGVESPVSPILSGEEVSRDSAVSPLQTQTLGIDETLQVVSEDLEITTGTVEDLATPTAPEGSQPPPTPRTPRTYSKSVQLQPTVTTTDTPSSNRHSLPPDMSTFGDTTLNTSSDMVTDVAVRFSLPQTTITVSKPQIIEIPPSSSPIQEQPQPRSSREMLRSSDSRSKRGSVMFADEVAPLNISKKPEQQPIIHTPTEVRAMKAKSIIRRPSPLQENKDPSRSSRSANDLRFSNVNSFNNRFGSTHLPGLKEESVDEMSISDHRAAPDKTGGVEFPLPARIAAAKAMQERRLQESAEKAKARRAARHPNLTLAEIRDLPSLNFSRMDLIDKLNEALEVRGSKSMEVIRRREFSGIYCPSPQRPQSTEPLRERYMSFFSKPEDFSSFFNTMANEESEVDSGATDTPPEPIVPTVEVQQSTELAMSDTSSRPLSPDDLMSVASEVNRLSIPSVTALSNRLSELLPNLRELQLDNILANLEQNEEFSRSNSRTRPETVLSSRTSAGFRTLAERAEEIVKNGTHDSTVPMGRVLSINKELPALPESVSAGKVTAANSMDGKVSYLSGSVSAPTDLCMGLTRPASALLKGKAPASEEEVRGLLPPEMNPITRHGKRALTPSTGSSRPWNQDGNYPWAGTKVDVDLKIPSQAHTRRSMGGESLPGRATKSLDLTSTGELTDTTKGIDIGSFIERNATETVTDEQLTGVVTSQHSRKQSKRSVIGSITRRMGLNSGCGGSQTTRSITSPTLSPELARSQSSQQAHRPGERYPTSSLTPPANFNLDEVRSFFSDESSEGKDQSASFRKRLTNFKGSKGNKTVRIDSARHSLQADTTYDAGEINAAERVGAASVANTYDGVGMGKTEFRIKRFGEKLRHLVAKGGELFRSWSMRSNANKVSRTERVREDWLSDSVYSGV